MLSLLLIRHFSPPAAAAIDAFAFRRHAAAIDAAAFAAAAMLSRCFTPLMLLPY